MLRAVEKLLKSDTDLKLGNHRREAQADGSIKYFYFGTAICQLWHSFKKFKIDNGGWNTSSTNRAIHDYVYNFKETLGYSQV